MQAWTVHTCAIPVHFDCAYSGSFPTWQLQCAIFGPALEFSLEAFGLTFVLHKLSAGHSRMWQKDCFWHGWYASRLNSVCCFWPSGRNMACSEIPCSLYLLYIHLWIELREMSLACHNYLKCNYLLPEINCFLWWHSGLRNSLLHQILPSHFTRLRYDPFFCLVSL